LSKWLWVQSGWTSYSNNGLINYALGKYARDVISHNG
jgi:hypothetical protein